MKRRVTAAFVGALLAAPTITACSDNNSKDFDAEEKTEYTTESEETTAETTTKPEKKSAKKAVTFADLPDQEEVNPQNRSQILFVMDDGSYIYPMVKNGSDGPVETYVSDDGKGEPKEMKLPEKSRVYYSDGKKLYFYAPEDGLCEYSDGKTSKLNKETVTADGDIPEREEFLFTKDKIYFASSDDESTEIRSMDYSGKLTDEVFSVDHKNARIIGISEINGRSCMVCGYYIGTSENIIAVDSDGFSDDVISGSNAYISGDDIYYIHIADLCRKPLSGGDAEKLTDERCSDFCISGEKIFFADATNVYSLDKKGKAEKIFSADKLTKCDYISRVCCIGDKLFVSGGSAAFWNCIAEIDEDGKLIKEYKTGIER